MKTDNDNTSSSFPLHTVKKVKNIEDRYSIPLDAESQVNQLLAKGWVLLALHTKEISPKEQRLIYTLGHTDVSADDTVEAIYTKPEDL